jgi:N-acetylneuraminic acid mutarotase
VLIYGRLTDPVGADRPGGLAAYDPVADEWSERAAIPLQGREAASVTWTGSELIVWGGLYLDISSALPLGDGAAYDPQTDTWRVLPPAPIVGRHHHGAVWTGDELVIWGGWSGAVPFSDGAAYNPETDSWRRMAASPLGASAPTATIWTGHDVLVVGGDGVRVFVGGTARYDPATDVWVALESPPPVACRGQSAVWTGESVLTWGGRKDCANTGDSQATTKGLMYRP